MRAQRGRRGGRTTIETDRGRQRSAPEPGGQSGDLQGISDIEGAGSESVEELLEEGSSFEAEVLQGVERAADAEEREVHTHEIDEDDVPKEYLDQEREDQQ